MKTEKWNRTEKCGRFSDTTKSWSGQPDHGQIRGGNNDEKEIIKRSYGIRNGTFPRSMRRSKDRDNSSRDNCREKRGDNNSRYDSSGDGRSSRRHTDRRLRSGFPANGICWWQRRIHRLWPWSRERGRKPSRSRIQGTADRLGLQGYGAWIRQHRLYLERIYDHRPRGWLYLDYTVYGKQAGIRCSERFRYQESGWPCGKSRGSTGRFLRGGCVEGESGSRKYIRPAFNDTGL